MNKPLPSSDSTPTIFKLQFDGVDFSTNATTDQSFWPLHNYSKEIKISNVIKIQIKDKTFLDKVKAGGITPERNDVFEGKMEIDGENYNMVEVINFTKSTKMQFKGI
jgi:hypothetical protein